mgnify:CR=1 FL=1
MNSVELIKKICKERKIPISKLERDLGYGNGYINQLKKGTIPSDRAIEISNYLQIDLQYLLSGGESSSDSSQLTTRDERDIKKDLDSLREKLENKEYGPAAYDGQDIPDEDIDLFLGQVELMLRRLKVKNKEKYNPNKNKK